MEIDAARFARDVLNALPPMDRTERLRELEIILNTRLVGLSSLDEFQQRLYDLIDLLGKLGHKLGPWDYDCEVELWGGDSYMDPSVPDELLLKSRFPKGVELRWGDGSDLGAGKGSIRPNFPSEEAET